MNPKKPVTWLGGLLALVSAPNPLSAQSVAPRVDESVVELSPFVVNTSKDTGYQAMSTLAGTRLDTPLKDIGASISVYTKDFLEDIGATNTNEVLIYATSMEAPGPGGNFGSAVRGGDISNTGGPNVDGPRSDPQGSSRSRGLTAPTFTRDFYATRIPGDSYNTDRVTVLRGPNAALFGVSSPSGVTDTSLARADLRRNLSKVAFRLDNNGGHRTTLDFNRVLVPDKFAARLVGVRMREEYNQRPAFENKERVYGTATYRPFPLTTVRANFESGRHRALRPYTITPTINMTADWVNNGRPGYDWRFYDDPARNPLAATQNAGNFLPFYIGQANFGNRVAVFYANPEDSKHTYAIRSTTPNTAANVANAVKNDVFHPLLNRDLAADTIGYTFALDAFEIPATAYWIGNRVLPGQLAGQIPPGMKPQNFTDFSAFDFRNRMLDESPRYSDNFHTTNITLEQRAWRNRVGIEFAYNQERLDRRTALNFFGGGQNNSNIRIDTTITLPNGQPNPNLGRPYALNVSGGFKSDFFIESETRRISGYLKYDFHDLNRSWGKWLGNHVLNSLVERFETESINYQPSYRPVGPVPQELTPVIGSRQAAFITYLGPSIIGNNNPLKLSPIRIGILPIGPVGTTSSFVRQADATSPGTFADSPLSFVHTVANGAITREVIESQAATLQSYWLQDHVVTIFGWRRDEDFTASRSINFVSNPSNLNDPGKATWGLNDLNLPNKPPPTVAAEVKSFSVVLRWPRKLIKLPAGVDFSVFYNNSENFTPLGNRVTWWGGGLPPPQGKTKEYGLNLSLFNDRLSIRLNHYENASKNLGGGGSASGLIGNLPLDTIIRWAQEGNTNPHLQAMRNADIALLKSALPVPNYTDLYNLTITGVAPNIAASRNSSLPFSSDISDLDGKGDELDIIYNATSNWRILANVAHQQVRRSKIGQNGKLMLEKMMPVIQQLSGRASSTYPVGWQIGDPLPATSETFGAFVERTVLLPLAIDRLLEGDPSAEQRPWRFNIVTNYKFGGSSIFGERLKGWSIGGGARWQDKLIMGYPSGRLANTQPTFDKAHPWYAPAELNIDAFVSYGRRIWDNRVEWKLQLNATNIYQKRELIPIQVQPWGQTAAVRLAPEQRWYLTNTFTF